MPAETEQQAPPELTAVPFRAEVKQLLHILAHSLYTDREIFLRELISNASDALYRVQFEMLTNQDVFDNEAELAVRIDFDEKDRTITIADSGIGMTREELIEHLGTIAQSGARALMERLEAGQRSEIIGQFGVGFYSAFVVADEVTVISRSFRPDAQAAMWRSSGDENFSVGPAEREHRGTSVILKLKEDAAEFANAWKLRQIIKRHSDFVAFPIYVKDEQANQQTALWRQPPRQVEAEKYREFYKQLTFDFEDPLLHLHLSTDAPVDLHAVLFVPARRERGLIDRRSEGKIRLYSRKVLIQEEARDLLPQYFRFVEGVVDSEDLPLNVSREMVQSSQVMSRIRKTLSSRLHKELEDLAQKDAEKYAAFWREFGVFLKEGVATDPAAQKDLLPLLRFSSTAVEDGLVSLADYKGRMVEGQKEIYYVLANDLESARRSPHLEPLLERGVEALLLYDIVDSFMATRLNEYDGLKLRNAADPGIELPGEAATREEGVTGEAFDRLAVRIKEVLGEQITEIRGTTLLRKSPARLVEPENAPNRDMERIQRIIDSNYKISAKIIELNRDHQLIKDLARLVQERPDDPLIAPLIQQIYDSALLIEGLHPNPAEMVERIQLFMEAAARGT